MRLNSQLLETFLVLSRELAFARAAELLHLSHSALTRRIQKLEEQVDHALFVRTHAGPELTEAGRILQRYALFALDHERELSTSLGQASNAGLGGFFRVAAFSSVLRSVVVPALGSLLREQPRLSCQVLKAEARDLHAMLAEGKVDYCVSLSQCERMGIESEQIGLERNVLIESARYRGRTDCYIDHGPQDAFTEKFFLCQTGKTVPVMLRAYFDDIYGLIDAVAQGVGRAVVPLSLIVPGTPVRPVPDFLPLDVPVFLHYNRQAHYTRLQSAVIETLRRECPPLLASNFHNDGGIGALAAHAPPRCELVAELA